MTPRTKSQWIPQPFRSFAHSCFKSQANSDGQSPYRAFYQKLKTYPELYETFKAARSRINKEVWAKLRAEPELLRAKQEELRYHHHHRIRFKDVEVRSKSGTRALAHYHAHKHEEILVRTRLIFSWCFGVDVERSAWAREKLPRKTHCPVQQHERTYQFYACCGMQRYMKSAWQSISDPSEFLCNKHYAERGWNLAMPEGYVDVRTLKGIRKRYEELNPGPSSKP
ncbi:hypothetical protein M436DRAFT_43569 [Aureobasidium namibiae CBS 147.97]|uniref:Uncharacterized protein n=1 Tax=Aureobasidium namibiae CBS 147.97 TaxID=1043004 RepID=A0A074WM60_9PEZI|nr:uncharacterized protein M436DRAFT_43569 [Aureobasidium namibiae CBS 147.97]KEQ74190.1 hypothetical protein M436DRAFT_43569 [Aureobasidium namibiae CBS 147.97]